MMASSENEYTDLKENISLLELDIQHLKSKHQIINTQLKKEIKNIYKFINYILVLILLFLIICFIHKIKN